MKHIRNLDLNNLNLAKPSHRDIVCHMDGSPEADWIEPEWMGGELTASPDLARSPRHSPGPITMYRLTNSLVFPRSVVIDPETGLIQPESAFRRNMSPTVFHGALAKNSGSFSYKGSFSLEEIPEAAKPLYSLDTDWPEPFGHILLDCLPRIWAIKHAPADTQLISSVKHVNVLNDFIRMCGVDAKVMKISSPIFAPEAYFADSCIDRKAWVHEEAREIISKIKSSVQAHQESSKSFPRKIFISRAKIPGRKLINELEVQRLFIKAGFVVVSPETYSLSDQIKLFMNATHVVGPGGSAMHMAIFCKSECVIGVISSPSWFFNADIVCSQISGAKLCHIIGEQNPRISKRSQAAFIVNTNVIKEFINDFCKSQSFFRKVFRPFINRHM